MSTQIQPAYVAIQDNSCCTRNCPKPAGPEHDGELWRCPECSRAYRHATHGWLSFWAPVEDRLLDAVNGREHCFEPISETAGVGAVRAAWAPITWLTVAAVAGWMIGVASAMWFCSFCV